MGRVILFRADARDEQVVPSLLVVLVVVVIGNFST